MYEGVDVISIAEATAEIVVAEDREKYKKFLAEIEKFAENERMVIGGEHATRLLLREPLRPDIGPIELYTPDALRSAKKLAVALYKVGPDGLGHYTTMLTKVPGNEFAVSVNARELVKVISLRARAMPVQRRAMFYEAGRPFCMPPEIQLIQVYGDLCNPAKATEWENLLSIEKKLREMVLSGLRPKIAAIQARRGGDSEKAPVEEARISNLAREISEVYAGGESRVQVGRSPPQFAVEDFEIERKSVSELAEKARVAIDVTEESCEIPMEPRLRRLSVSVTDSAGEKREMLRLFNAAAFELVPFESEKNRQVGNVLVVMRFALIEVWSTQLKIRTRELTEEVGRKVLLKAVGKYEDAAKEFAKTIPLEDAIDLLFPLDSSLGQLESLELARRRHIYEQTKKSAVRYPPFYPAKRE